MENIYICILALLLDTTIGELPNRFHPVAWLGKLIDLELKNKPATGKLRQIVYGILLVLLTAAIITAAIYLLLSQIHAVSKIFYIIAAAIIFEFTFALRGLIRAANLVKIQLASDQIEDSRNNLKTLVSRDTTRLSKSEIIAATVESVAENSCDSFVAPLFYFMLFGIPGAVAYRIINTFDAMIGYHGSWEYIGKFAARLDDLANFLPARITAILIILSSFILRMNLKQSWYIMLRDHHKTESPNAGWTMSAMAGALDIQLNKSGSYQLGNNVISLSTTTIDSALHLVLMLNVVWIILVCTIRGAIIVAA